MNTPIKLRWVMAHVPYDLFLRSAQIFAKKLHEKTNGRIEIEIMGAEEYIDRYAPGKTVEELSFATLVNEGKIELCQMYNTVLSHYNTDMRVLDLPFMFRDHDHATKVLDGEIGQDLLAGLAKKSNIRGLAFTYSGGFRMMVGKTANPVTSIDDFRGQRVRTSSTPVAQKAFENLGATPVNVPIHKMAEAFRDDLVDIGENTWARYFRTGIDKVTEYVANTEHSLFLTAIIVNEQVWQSFSPEIQAVMKEIALEAAVSERAESLEDNEIAKARCLAEGIPVIEWTDEERNRYKQSVQSVYDYFESQLPEGLINAVKNVH